MREQVATVADEAELLPRDGVECRAEGGQVDVRIVRENRQDGTVKMRTRVLEKGLGLAGSAIDVDPGPVIFRVATSPVPPVAFVKGPDATGNQPGFVGQQAVGGGSSGPTQIIRRVLPVVRVEEQTKSRLPCSASA